MEKNLIRFFLIALFFNLVLSQEQKDPRIGINNRQYETAPPTPPKTFPDVKLKDGNPPFVYLGVEPNLPNRISPSGSTGKGVTPGTPVTIPISSGVIPNKRKECRNCPCVPKKKKWFM